MKQPRHTVLRSKQAAVLRTKVRVAYEHLQQGQATYDQALVIPADTDLGPEGFLALYRQDRDYATAVLIYSNAVMVLSC